jgi:HAD-superfamily hydrolase, subfamily IIB
MNVIFLFALISGRFRAGLTFLIKELGIEGCPIGCFNGAYVEADGNVLSENKITNDQIRRVLAITRKLNVTSVIFDLDDWYMEENEGYWWNYQGRMAKKDGIFVSFDAFLDNLDKKNESVFKIIPKELDHEKAKLVYRILKEEFCDELEIYMSAPTNIEIVAKGVEKGNVISVFADYYKIPQSTIMAFGDYDNDLSMLQASGYPVAMGNGVKKIKDIAYYVTEDNNSDGLGKALKKFFF